MYGGFRNTGSTHQGVGLVGVLHGEGRQEGKRFPRSINCINWKEFDLKAAEHFRKGTKI